MDKKETLWALGLGLALFAGVPALARYLLPPEAGMAFSMLFLLAVHPAFFLPPGPFADGGRAAAGHCPRCWRPFSLSATGWC